MLPTALAVGVLVFLIAADAPSTPLTLGTIQAGAAAVGAVGVIIIFAVSAAVAISLQPLQFRLVQLLEGYWPAWFPLWIARVGVRLEMCRRDRVSSRLQSTRRPTSEAAAITGRERKQAAETQLRQRFPADDRLLPTALGNALRAAEDSVGKRYGLESVVMWPRLFQVLPERVRAGVDDEVTQLDVSVRLAVTWTAAGVASSFLLLRDWSSLATYPLWVLVPVGIFVLARLAYQSAVESAIAHGGDLEVAVDLYRARVIDAMRLRPTTSLQQEIDVFGELTELFQSTSPSELDLNFDPKARAGGPAD
ncbi:hypothetical protein [Microbacterium sp. P03]|uniref:hypothetical protein n=1 Tax=Microbacterium sp. P03 TaxID=3366946 RepID=UPI003745141B